MKKILILILSVGIAFSLSCMQKEGDPAAGPQTAPVPMMPGQMPSGQMPPGRCPGTNAGWTDAADRDRCLQRTDARTDAASRQDARPGMPMGKTQVLLPESVKGKWSAAKIIIEDKVQRQNRNIQ